jgi:hypothetical protein
MFLVIVICANDADVNQTRTEELEAITLHFQVEVVFLLEHFVSL